MRPTFLAKTFGALGLLTILSAMIGTSVQQNARAQNGVEPNAETVCVLPENRSSEDRKELEYSPEQLAAYRQFSDESSKRAAALANSIQTVPDPSGGFSYLSDGEIPDEVQKAIDADLGVFAFDQVPDTEQVNVLNEKYGQYVTFNQATKMTLTPEQIAENDAIDREFDAKMLSVLTFEQQQIYLHNLVIDSVINACDTDRTDG